MKQTKRVAVRLSSLPAQVLAAIAAPLLCLALITYLLWPGDPDGQGWRASLRQFGVAIAPWMITALTVSCAWIVVAVATRRNRAERDFAAAELQAEVSRREQAEAALRQAQRMDALGRLMRGIAHDFNNHLTAVSSNVELLARRLAPDSTNTARLANAAMQGVQRAARLAHRLLAFSRPQVPDPEPVDAGRVVSEMSDLLRRTLGESITVNIRLASGLWLTWADPNQLEAVLLHLAVDARDALPNGGVLAFETENMHLEPGDIPSNAFVQAGDFIVVAITGAVSASVFRPLEPAGRLLSPGACNAPDLPVIAATEQAAGGFLRSFSDDGCTRVVLYLPRYAPHEVRPAATRGVPVSSGRGSERILVVEDDDDVRLSSVEVLRDLGYAVLEAPDAMEAVRLLADRGGADLLFTDIGLPGGVNGKALAEAARKIIPDIRVLFTTGYREVSTPLGDKGRADDAHLLSKPFTFDELAAKVREALDGHPARAPVTMRSVADA